MFNLQDLDDESKRDILDRSGQFEDENGEGSNVCKIHREALTTKFKQNADCVAENHDKEKSRRLRGNDLTNAKPVSPALSKHVLNATGFLLPVGGKICAKCRRELSITIPLPNPWPNKRKLVDMPPPQTAPLPKRQKVETRLSMDFLVYGLSKKVKKSDIRSDPNGLGIHNSENENADLGQTRATRTRTTPPSPTRLGSSSESTKRSMKNVETGIILFLIDQVAVVVFVK